MIIKMREMTHTSVAAVHNLNIETSRVRVRPPIIVIGSRVEAGRIHIQTQRPSPSPHHHMSTVLDIHGQIQCHVVGLLVHVGVLNINDSVCRKVRLHNIVGFDKVALVCKLGLLLAGPIHADKTRITVIRRAYVPARVAITPKAHAERSAGLSNSHRGASCVGIGLRRVTSETASVLGTVEIPGIIGGF